MTLSKVLNKLKENISIVDLKVLKITKKMSKERRIRITQKRIAERGKIKKIQADQQKIEVLRKKERLKIKKES